MSQTAGRSISSPATADKSGTDRRHLSERFRSLHQKYLKPASLGISSTRSNNAWLPTEKDVGESQNEHQLASAGLASCTKSEARSSVRCGPSIVLYKPHSAGPRYNGL